MLVIADRLIKERKHKNIIRRVTYTLLLYAVSTFHQLYMAYKQILIIIKHNQNNIIAK